MALSLNFGDNLCLGHNPGATGGFGDLGAHCYTAEGLRRPESETRRNSENIDRALTYIRENPGETLRRTPSKLRYTLQNDWDGLQVAEDFGARPLFSDSTRGLLRATATGFYAVVGVVAIGGGVVLLRRRRPRPRPVPRGRGLAQLISPLATFGDPRFKMPLYPTLAVCAAAGARGPVGVVGRRRDGDAGRGSEAARTRRGARPLDGGAVARAVAGGRLTSPGGGLDAGARRAAVRPAACGAGSGRRARCPWRHPRPGLGRGVVALFVVLLLDVHRPDVVVGAEDVLDREHRRVHRVVLVVVPVHAVAADRVHVGALRARATSAAPRRWPCSRRRRRVRLRHPHHVAGLDVGARRSGRAPRARACPAR